VEVGGMEKRMVIEQLSPSSVDHHDGHHRRSSARFMAEQSRGRTGRLDMLFGNEIRSVIRGRHAADSFFVLPHKNNYPDAAPAACISCRRITLEMRGRRGEEQQEAGDC
jgi:hypothetical protein